MASKILDLEKMILSPPSSSKSSQSHNSKRKQVASRDLSVSFSLNTMNLYMAFQNKISKVHSELEEDKCFNPEKRYMHCYFCALIN